MTFCSIAQRSEKGAIAANKISKRATSIKEIATISQKKTADLLLHTKMQLEQAIADSKVVGEIDILSKAIMDI
ncbi:methyl-accepting chemotaxis protein, partial [Clostridium perfringens]|nr:methyl-accepting chemotaxis protein [Clostridium perfringens]